MADMVERVARAIDPEAWADDMPVPTRADTVGFHRRRQDSARLARAAIEAMREPTDEMRLASKRYKRKAKVYSGPACYREMIDAALASEPKP